MPAQLRRTALTLRAVAQQEHRTSGTGRAHAEPPAGSKIEQFLVTGNIGHHPRYRPAGNRLLGGPQQLTHIGWTHQDHRVRVKPEMGKTRPIGHAQFLRLVRQLQINDGNSAGRQQAAHLGQSKPEACSGVAAVIRKYFLQQTAGKFRKTPVLDLNSLPSLGQRWFALNIGNGIPQRGDALLAIGRGHSHQLLYVNKTRTW
ncbi:hypothetical protein WH91_18430 [Devosia psychrophila]|uniref:Uncharacterized protein n=1 Tax=Devosia psychrophila TaxID=728005 RepID=A0ABR5DUI9_9HYPH|nr:hypothetical protein WH91_18430 [Devosia psychrophila]